MPEIPRLAVQWTRHTALFVFAAGLLLSIAASVLVHLPVSSASVGFVFLCTLGTVPPPRFPAALTTFAIEPVALFLLASAAIGYLVLLQRVRATPLRRRFARWRAASFLLGLGLVLLTVFGPLAAYDHTFLTIHMVQHFLLITIAPPLLLAGAPLTLLLVSLPAHDRKTLIYPVLHSRPFHALTNPAVGVALFALVPTVWYVTPLFESSLSNPWVHYFGYSLFLFAGIHYWWPLVPANPTRWRLPYPVQLLYLLALVPIHAFLGLLFYEPEKVIYPALARVPRAWGPAPLLDQHAAGAFMFVAGELLGLVALLIVAARWASAEERTTARREARERRTASGSS